MILLDLREKRVVRRRELLAILEHDLDLLLARRARRDRLLRRAQRLDPLIVGAEQRPLAIVRLGCGTGGSAGREDEEEEEGQGFPHQTGLFYFGGSWAHRLMAHGLMGSWAHGS
ncbi:MAG: hypothetical protein DMF56_20950 [Acidobacteria bacterium]|nr:MAG: hypothetical protein DMF56_20950 [Acidobacteriota bacterium]